MKKIFLLFLLFVSAHGSASDGANEALPGIELPSELSDVLRNYEKTWNSGDAKGLSMLFHADGFVLPNGRHPIQGRANIEKYYSDGGSPISLRAFDYAVDRDLAIILGGLSRESGAPDLAKFTLTLKKVEGKWFIHSDMDNGNRRRR